MPTKLAEIDQMTIDEFLAFTDERPSGERWELIEGVPIMNPSPTNWHQVICGNVYMALGQVKAVGGAAWVPALGTGTRVPVSPRSLPQPDVMVVPGIGDQATPVIDDALVIFEVLSRSNTRADQAWRRKVYASVPNCRHYVTVHASSVAVVRYDRDGGWGKAADLTSLDDELRLPALGAALPLTQLYQWTPLGRR